MSSIVYGVGDMICTIGISSATDGGSPLPFIGFINQSKLPKEGLEGKNVDEKAVELINIIKDAGGTIIYFDNPESAERFHKLTSFVFTMACQGDWADREQIRETIN